MGVGEGEALRSIAVEWAAGTVRNSCRWTVLIWRPPPTPVERNKSNERLQCGRERVKERDRCEEDP